MTSRRSPHRAEPPRRGVCRFNRPPWVVAGRSAHEFGAGCGGARSDRGSDPYLLPVFSWACSRSSLYSGEDCSLDPVSAGSSRPALSLGARTEGIFAFVLPLLRYSSPGSWRRLKPLV